MIFRTAGLQTRSCRCFDEKQRSLTLFVVNRDPGTMFNTTISVTGGNVRAADLIELTGESPDASNTLENRNRNSVRTRTTLNVTPVQEIVFRPGSITVCRFRLDD